MKKVVAFLEQYAEWLALGVAAIFFLVVVWGALNPTAIQVKVAGKDESPGDVDPKVQTEVAQRLTPAMEAKAEDLVISVPNFAQQFELAMGPKRPHTGAEYYASAH